MIRRFKKEDRKAQFYLLAAIVIIALILGLAAVTNYIKKRGAVKIYDVKEELNIESGNVLDFGTYKKDQEVKNLSEHFTTLYTTYAGEDKDIYYIFGHSGDIKAYSYGARESGTIDVTIGETPLGLDIFTRVKNDLGYREESGKIKVTINDVPYEFDLQPGENFYFVISQEIEGEKHVVSG